MNLRFLVAAAASICAVQAMADHMYTSAKWQGWEIATGEELWQKQRHTSYPVWQMFDQDPKTSWVYSGGFEDWKVDESPSTKKKVAPLRECYWIQLTPKKSLRVDEIRLMNGYNKDSFTFGRNARITEVEVFAMNSAGTSSAEKRKIGKFRLSDAMGWHTIKISGAKYDSLRIEVTGIHRGTDPDVAVSELQLLSKGKSVGPSKADYVVFNPGDECGCGGIDSLRASDGTTLATTSSELEGIAPSPRGRYYAGGDFDDRDRTIRLWVYDTGLRKRVWNRRYKEGTSPQVRFDRRGWLRAATGASDIADQVLWKPNTP